MMCCCSSTSGTGGGAGTGSVEMGCGRSGCTAIGSTDTSKCSPRRPDSCCTSGCGSAGDAQMKSQTGTEEGAETSDDDAFLADNTIEHQHTFFPPVLMVSKNIWKHCFKYFNF
jgi:hypothetical protein